MNLKMCHMRQNRWLPTIPYSFKWGPIVPLSPHHQTLGTQACVEKRISLSKVQLFCSLMVYLWSELPALAHCYFPASCIADTQ